MSCRIDQHQRIPGHDQPSAAPGSNPSPPRPRARSAPSATAGRLACATPGKPANGGALWTIVLASGEGLRLAALTRDDDGVVVPKQFCSFDGRRSLLQAALERADRIVPPERQVVVVAEHHERWWRQELAHLPRENVIVQPLLRGTAAGLLLPLLDVLRRERNARLIVLPSDHHVADEAVLESALRAAAAHSRVNAGQPVVLGIEPEHADTGYGWIVPVQSSDRCAAVEAFVEKPAAPEAAALMERGAVWSSFMLASSAEALLRCFDCTVPGLVEAFARTSLLPGVPPSGACSSEELRRLYDGITARDFSRDVLEPMATTLRVFAVPTCGWTDLGTPERVAQCDGLTGDVARRARDLVSRARVSPDSIIRSGRTGGRRPAPRSVAIGIAKLDPPLRRDVPVVAVERGPNHRVEPRLGAGGP